LILAKTADSARSHAKDIQGPFTQKTYLARVSGKFGGLFDEKWNRSSMNNESDIGWTYEESGSSNGAGWIKVQQPIRCVSHKRSTFECAVKDPTISSLNQWSEYVPSSCKLSTTLFRLVSYDGATSIVECRPLTGRTHQVISSPPKMQCYLAKVKCNFFYFSFLFPSTRFGCICSS
jgi:23S rRNA-/tRNA-specific pseudouridylate synthase